jgi:hypothetical protein
MDITATLAPKSDQLNSDDLIAGPRTITVTKVSAGSVEQPVAIAFEGDNNKPWYPCKSMRRVLVAAWGADSSQYLGRRITLFRDPSVTYGSIQVGGIRVSHLSHLDGPLSIALTVTRKKRTPYRVQPLEPLPTAAAPAPPAAPVEDLLAQAEASCRAAGLTDAGIAALVHGISQGKCSSLRDLPLELLTRLGKAGVSPEMVSRCNGAAPDPELPAAESA